MEADIEVLTSAIASLERAPNMCHPMAIRNGFVNEFFVLLGHPDYPVECQGQWSPVIVEKNKKALPAVQIPKTKMGDSV